MGYGNAYYIIINCIYKLHIYIPTSHRYWIYENHSNYFDTSIIKYQRYKTAVFKRTIPISDKKKNKPEQINYIIVYLIQWTTYFGY